LERGWSRVGAGEAVSGNGMMAGGCLRVFVFTLVFEFRRRFWGVSIEYRLGSWWYLADVRVAKGPLCVVGIDLIEVVDKVFRVWWGVDMGWWSDCCVGNFGFC